MKVGRKAVCDRFGHRLSGTPQLEAAIDWCAQRMKDKGLANVHKEEVMVPVWVRGEESAFVLEPARHELSILGLIHIAAEFYLAFTYANNPNRVRGVASLKVRIEILFFEKTFELKVEREFKGGGGGGDFFVMGADARPAGLLAAEGALGVSDLMSEADWSSYCEAFA